MHHKLFTFKPSYMQITATANCIKTYFVITIPRGLGH